MSVNEKMTAIADRLRLHTGTVDKLSLDEMVTEIDSVSMQMYLVFRDMEAFYGATLPDAFWDVLQIKGERRNYSQVFMGNLFTDATFKPKYNLIVTNAYRMFQSNIALTDLRKSNIGIDMDFSQCTDFSMAFGGMVSLKYIGDISTVGANEVYRSFMGCAVLEEVGTFTVKEETTFNNPFAQCRALTTITFAGTIGQDFTVPHSPLNRASIESIVRCLSPVAEDKTLTLKSGIVNTAFETSSGASDGESAFLAFVDELGKDNWNISY